MMMVLNHTKVAMYALVKRMHSVAIAASMVFMAIASAMSLIVAASNVFIFFTFFCNCTYTDHKPLYGQPWFAYLHLSSCARSLCRSGKSLTNTAGLCTDDRFKLWGQSS
ncbi:hypothetical protein [Mucilaginibacter polytrichastri]|uniref:hypothetical protein n=1 Tax=Mucilaginibacter polytrichastri TaxID=1302689 RepID=UPI000A8BA879|nr:hypothetical protein [Mucilaginibacter polytrichastri]